MGLVLWVIAGILAAIFLAAGTTKLLRTKDAPEHVEEPVPAVAESD